MCGRTQIQVWLEKKSSVELNYENIMEHVKQDLNTWPEKAATYSFLADEPTMTNSRVEAMGTGSHTSYVKIATGFQNSFVQSRSLPSIFMR